MKIKKLLIFAVTCALGFSTQVSADCSNYTEEEYDYLVKNTAPTDLDLTCSNGTLFTDEYLSRVEQHISELESQSSNTSIMPRYYTYKLSITPVKQANGHFCGPANIEQVVEYLDSSNTLDQDDFAVEMGTTKDGTIVYNMWLALNKYTSKSYSYTLGNKYTASTFSTLIKNNVTENKPTILHAQTKTLAMYNGTDLGHYITVNGYTLTSSLGGGTGIENIYYVDPYYVDYGDGSVFGEHMDTTSNVFGTVNYSTRYIIH